MREKMTFVCFILAVIAGIGVVLTPWFAVISGLFLAAYMIERWVPATRYQYELDAVAVTAQKNFDAIVKEINELKNQVAFVKTPTRRV